ncbi:Ig-like domain-containing protein [Yersinia enterocolitica]|uniref:Ig-like domain-containing protein n=1 Tax=Yersinia enterocolitica TaxID=630 RepID=UPI00065A8F7D|nr:Ig-like domain-containing protein [Yersinia enterocolitica]CRX97093.1 Bacterial Ig-like domain (group 1) [Yersinia enterocolitica]
MSTNSFDSSMTCKWSTPPLTDDGANADNVSKITAAVIVAQGDSALYNKSVTFEIIDNPGVFFDNNKTSSDSLSNVNGIATKLFKSAVVGTGKITAYLTDNPLISAGIQNFEFKEWQPSAALVTTVIINNGADMGGNDPITVAATVTDKNGKAPLSGVRVHFELLDSEDDTALFSDTTTSKSQGITDVNGEISKLFIDSVAETGSVHVYVSSSGGDKIPATDKPFQFSPIQADSMQLSLSNDGAFAGGEKITVKASLTNKGNPLPSQKVNFILPDSSAVFVDGTINNDGYSITSGVTGPEGTVSKEFTDNVWEEGTVNASTVVSGSQQVPLNQDKKFLFNEPPSLQIELQPLQVKSLSTGEWISGSDAAADGKTQIQVTAQVSVADDRGIRGPLADVEGVFLLPTAEHAIFVDPNNPYKISGKTNSKGEISQQFTSEYIESTSSANIVTGYISGHNGSQLSKSLPYSFSDPWQDVAQITASLSGLSSASIYTNGLHQAVYQLSFVLASAGGTRLNSHNQPTVKDVINRVKLVDFNNKNQELGTGILASWQYTLEPNDFDKQLASSVALVEAQWDDSSARIDNGVAYITYYITCKSTESLNRLQIGLAISPTGSSQIIYDAVNEKIEKFVTINLMAEINYYRSNLSLLGKHQKHPGESDSDDQLAMPNGIEPDGNFWRQWDYTLAISDNSELRKIRKCLLISELNLPDDYSFFSKSNIIYNNKAYFWPNNVTGSNGDLLAYKENYPVQSTGTPAQQITVPSGDNSRLYFSIYSAFGYINVGEVEYKQIDFKLYDQYGNSGDFSIDPEAIPSDYNSNKMGDINFVKDRIPGVMSNSSIGIKTDLFISSNTYNTDTIGICSDSFITDKIGGTVLDLKSSSIAFSITPSSPQDQNNPKRIFNIVYNNINVSNYLKINNSAVITTSDSSITWNLKPIWNDNYVVISNSASPGNISWYPAPANDSKTGEHIFVYVDGYSVTDNSFLWFLSKGK